MYTVGDVPAAAAPAPAPAANVLQQGVGGTPGALALFEATSRLIGKVIAVNAGAGAGAVVTYTVQFGPVGAEGAAAVAVDALQILNIPEADLKKITILNNVVVAGVGGSRKKRQSKKKNNKHNHKNNQ